MLLEFCNALWQPEDIIITVIIINPTWYILYKLILDSGTLCC